MGMALIFIGIAVSIFLLDFVIKGYIEKKIAGKEEQRILKEKIIIKKHHNYGAALNFMDRKPRAVLIFSSIIFGLVLIIFGILLTKKRKVLLKTAFSFLIGGAASNIYDRAVRGYVVDYFSIHTGWKVMDRIIFNLSDWFIFIGSLLAILSEIVYK